MNPQNVLNIVLAAAVLVWIISRQLRVRPLREQHPYALMAVMGAVGLYQVAELASRSAVSAAAWVALTAGLLSGALFGWLRGRCMHVWRDGGSLMRQGNWLTVLLWVVGLGIHVGLDAGGVALSAPNTGVDTLGTAGILLYLALTLAAQRLATLVRARRLDAAAAAYS